ncbi:hypothetical protein OL548_18615 [Lysinibacillus sp. MHQ-1]|nr:hypothetical protein OL548_18615 [Lysinibacillus sp. MHQ-1]
MQKTILLFILGFMVMGLSAANYYFIFFIIGMIAFFDGCANPIRQTLTPYYVKPEKLLQANGISETITQVIQAGMWFVGSSLLIIMSAQQLIWLVGCLFVTASVLLCLLESVNNHPSTEIKGET